MEKRTETSMSWIHHLADLRKRLIYVLLIFALLMGICLALVSQIYGYFVHPLTADHIRLVVMSPGEVISVYLAIAGLTAVGLTLPFALYHLWRFVSPGLTVQERHYTLRLLPVILVMFILGVCFAWFLIFPTILHFLIQISEQHFVVMMRAESYFSFLTAICIPFGFIFELPVVVVFLTRIGVLSPKGMRKGRRYAYLVIVVLGVLISPPELISHLSVVLPMVLLYEVSIVLSYLVLKRLRKQRKNALQVADR